MIPKTIHYCWFGNNPLPEISERCIQSWREHCPDYEIVLWNEENYDLSNAPLYVQQAYQEEKWAYATDYIRLWIIYHYGGIYLDTDVELIRNVDDLLDCQAFFGFENTDRSSHQEVYYINTGLGFGAVKYNEILLEMMEDYQQIPFIINGGHYDALSCAKRNTHVLVSRGMSMDGNSQFLEDNIRILSTDWLCPMDYMCGILECTENTHSIHHFATSGLSPYERFLRGKRLSFIKKYGLEPGLKKAKNWTRMHKFLRYSLYVKEKGWKAALHKIIIKF